LCLTQRGRIEYAGHGGRINIDAIDNSAGVDCSDHEVNLKILLGLAIEAGELLERTLEFLPTPEQMAERRVSGNGLVRPELCVLLAYAKRLLREQVLASQLPDDPYLDASLAEYFPPAVVERFGHLMAAHP